MPPISKYSSSIRGGFGKFARAVHERWAVLTITILGICVPVYAMAWFFDLSNNLISTIAITVLVTLLPFMKLLLPRERWTSGSFEVWYACFYLITLALVVGNRYDLQLISFSAISVGMAIPGSLVVGIVVRQEMILLAGFLPALIAMMVYWVAGLAVNNGNFDLILLPLPVVFIGGAIWAPVALLISRFARLHKDGKVSGPAMQVVTMTTLFFPIALVAIVLPADLGLSSTWSNVSLALIGIFVSGVVSEPLRRLFIEWGKLAPQKN